jgi:anti-sigma regulatory factor (Ser/Thr protein kinase)
MISEPTRRPVVTDRIIRKLPCEPGAAALARQQLRAETVGLPRSVVEDALLLASELVANAVRFGHPPVLLTIDRSDERLRISVGDAATTVPQPPATSSVPVDQPGGRGLNIDAVAGRWGIAPGIGGPGKSIWFELDLS